MPFTPAMAAALTCPGCAAGPLELVANSLRCPGCQVRYPFVGTIPCLVPDPPLWHAQWLSRLAEFVTDTRATLAGWRADADAGAAQQLPRTRARIDRVIAACEDQRAGVEALFEDLRQGQAQLLPTRAEPGANPLLEFSENLFRDWVWGDKEAELTRALVANAVDQPLGRLAVYGAGTGRLAVDVHRSLAPAETWALDVNPLPVLVGERLLRGETVTLPEFPVAPHGEKDVVIQRDLRCPVAVREGFSFAFADALRPPFAPGSLDTVLTAWFVDATGRDFRETAAAVNRVLRPGGLWLNLGPLRFKESLAQNYTIEEIWDLVASSAFDLGKRGREDVPYFDSPASGSRRIETVFWFAARKTGEAQPFASPDDTPPWIADASLPIPLTPQLVAFGQKSVFAGSVLTLVDGARSLSDVAAEMGRLWGFDSERIMDQLRAFFATLPLDG
ncbi:MAG TPA: class I SAM-dependent methyltransferase [Polyangia bacterium]|nr:class I SAM-dependent methyltransferase [Polyangia bacterium]